MWWLLIWACLLVFAGVYLGARAWGLWGQTRELGSELVIAQQRLDDVQGQLDVLGERISRPEELAVLSDPAVVRKERERASKAARRARRQRRGGSHPAWVKHVD